MNSIHYVLRKSDHKKASRIVSRLRKQARINALRSTFLGRCKDNLIGLAIIFFIIIPILCIVFQNDWLQNLKTVYAAFGLFLLFVIGRYYYDLVNFDEMMKEIIGRYPSRSVYLTESGIVFENKYSATNLKFESIREVKEIKEFIFIFWDDFYAHFIPRRAFSDDAERNNFLSVVANRSSENHNNSINADRVPPPIK